MARQATRGLDGLLRFTISIPVRIGREEIVKAIAYFQPEDQDPLPQTRTDAKRLARDLLAKYGTDGLKNAPNTTTPGRLNLIRAYVDEIFKELNPQSDSYDDRHGA